MSLSPQQIRDLHRQAEKALLAGRPREAHRHCLAILEADRRHADAWFICGVIAGRNGQAEKAVQIIGNACALAPRRAEYRAELGKYLLASMRNREALQAAIEAAGLEPDSIPTLNTLGSVFSHCGEHARAIDCYERAAALLAARRTGEAAPPDADGAELYFNLAVSLQFAGRIDDAELAFEKAIALRPDYFKAHSALSTLRRQTDGHNHLERLTGLRERARSPIDRLHIGHALAKEQEDLGRYREAMASLGWAKRAHARQVAYDFDGEKRLFDSIKSALGKEGLDGLRGSRCSSHEPIFIVGMPRTGTTLVEQILGSHSQVFAAGELQQFPQQLALLGGPGGAAGANTNFDAGAIASGLHVDMTALGESYIEATRPRTGHTPRFTDKLPRNFLHLGLIHRALPNAKIVCLRRDPMDTCLSNYRQLFTVNAAHYHYNLDLTDCGRYFIQFDLLMRHWRELLPGAVHEVSYEALVRDPPAEIARLLAYCELPWEDACLRFHQRGNAVGTPSAVQVKQGMYATSIGRWQKYGDAMRPLFELLREAGYYD